MKKLELKYCNSASKPLIRAADIVANKIYFLSLHGGDYSQETAHRHMYIKQLP